MLGVPRGDATELHADLAALAFMLGRWAGEGEGEYPTVEPFRYGEEMTFSHVGKPYLAYAQRSWSLDDGRPLHAETGYWRRMPGGRVEIVIAHPTGHTEVSEGTLDATSVTLESSKVTGTPSAKQVERIVRRFDVAGEQMRYVLEMAAVGRPLEVHLRATLRRVAGP